MIDECDTCAFSIRTLEYCQLALDGSHVVRYVWALCDGCGYRLVEAEVVGGD